MNRAMLLVDIDSWYKDKDGNLVHVIENDSGPIIETLHCDESHIVTTTIRRLTSEDVAALADDMCADIPSIGDKVHDSVSSGYNECLIVVGYPRFDETGHIVVQVIDRTGTTPDCVKTIPTDRLKIVTYRTTRLATLIAAQCDQHVQYNNL